MSIRIPLRLYEDARSGVHAWVCETDWCRLWLVLSPALHRGFSGEGQVLHALAADDWQDRVDELTRALETRFDRESRF